MRVSAPLGAVLRSYAISPIFGLAGVPVAAKSGDWRCGILKILILTTASEAALARVTLTLALSHQGRGDLQSAIRAWFPLTRPC